MRPRRVRAINRLLALAGFGALLMAGTGVARADHELTQAEAAYAATYGSSVICPTLADYPSIDGVMGVAQVLMTEGWSPQSTANIIIVSVEEYCPRFRPLLLAFAAASGGGA